jgi:hypothetical protein
MNAPDRSVQDMVHSQILRSLVALVSRHDPKLLIRLEAEVGRFVSTLPVEQQATALACFSSFMGGVVSADFRAGAESLFEGAPDWIKTWLDDPHSGSGNTSAAINFEVIPRNAKWRITQEGKLYGEFADRDDALKTVKAAVDAIREAGGEADWFDAVQ